MIIHGHVTYFICTSVFICMSHILCILTYIIRILCYIYQIVNNMGNIMFTVLSARAIFKTYVTYIIYTYLYETNLMCTVTCICIHDICYTKHQQTSVCHFHNLCRCKIYNLLIINTHVYKYMYLNIYTHAYMHRYIHIYMYIYIYT